MNFYHLLERKKEIDQLVGALRCKHNIPPISRNKLDDIVKAHDIQTHPIKFLLTAYSCSGHIIYPPINPQVDMLNIAHELGHLILNSDNEIEANYFSAALLADKSPIKQLIFDHYISTRAAVGYTAKLYPQFKFFPNLVKPSITYDLQKLLSNGVSQEDLNDIITDLNKVFAILVKPS